MTAFLKRFLKNKEAQNAGWIIGGKIAQMLLSLAVGILSARYLGPGNYGLINYGNAYVSFFTSFCTLGINSVIIKNFVDHPDEEGEALGSTIGLQFMSTLLSMITVMGVVSFLDRDDPTAITVVFLCCVGALLHVFDSLRFWFQARYQSKVNSLSALCAYIATSAYKIVLLILGKSVYWFAFAASVDYIFAAAFLLFAYRRQGGPKLSFSFQKSAQLLKSSYPYILAGAMVSVYAQTDKIMLKMYLSEEEVGFYATAITL